MRDIDLEHAWWSIVLPVGTEWFKQLEDGNLLVRTDSCSSAAFASRLDEAMEQMLPLVKRSDRKVLYGHRKLCALYCSSTDEDADGSDDRERAFVEMYTALYRCVKLVVLLAAQGSRRMAVQQLVRERLVALQAFGAAGDSVATQKRGHSRNASIDSQVFHLDRAEPPPVPGARAASNWLDLELSSSHSFACDARAPFGCFGCEQLALPPDVPLKLSREFVPPLTRTERCAIKKLDELCALVREQLSSAARYNAHASSTLDLVRYIHSYLYIVDPVLYTHSLTYSIRVYRL